MPLPIDNITSREALELLEHRFPGQASLARIYDANNIIRGYELKLGHKAIVIVGNLVARVMVELFSDAHAYGVRKETLRRKRRAARPNWEAQAEYDARWGTDNGGLVDPMAGER